ncbi:FAD-dependent oxidoreductase [Patescibacteria group bacterium]|nr:FAD-dependent oxidoreductase [Patescibacteria group bacterium]MBU1674059.1 FAD-dependent oxidoreductase [Patescibacteria group bacterium]MBU1963108.1 FAD-dependent oxidoreductase [Patescibacteria group bacterium]
MKDVIIVGGGPAGLTAALYTSRRTLDTVVIAKDLGGQMATTNEIENYPGFDQIDGVSLALKMKEQIEKFGAEFTLGTVEKIEKIEDENFRVTYNNDQVVEGKSVILAFGLTPRNLEVPGEEEYQGKGVTYCANCDGPLYKNKLVAVIGGGNAALDAADYLARIAKKVYLVHRREKFRGEEVIVNQIINNKNIELVLDSEIKEVKGEKFVTGITVENIKTKKTKDIGVQGVFVEIGRVAKTDFLQGVVDMNDKKEVITSEVGVTSTPGIFGAGDITDVANKQIAIATGTGVNAALSCYTYLQKKSGNATPIGSDWGKKDE